MGSSHSASVLKFNIAENTSKAELDNWAQRRALESSLNYIVVYIV